MSNPEDQSETAARFAHIEHVYTYHQVADEEVISTDDLPVFVKLGRSAVDHLVIVNPALDLIPSEQASSMSQNHGTQLNLGLGTLIINPATYSIDRDTGFKGLRSGEAVVFGRAHQTRLHRFQPFSSDVSREHAVIEKTADGNSVIIRDLHSTNGTYVGKLAVDVTAEDLLATVPNATEAEYDAEPLPTERAYGSSIVSDKHPEINEDSFLIDDQHGLYAVFDGVGGHDEGDVASQTARNVIAAQAADLDLIDDPLAVNEQLLTMLAAASRAVATYAPDGATTAVLAKLSQIGSSSYLSVAHIGDSRAYILREGALTALTTDHTPYRDQAGTGEAMQQQERLADTDSLGILSDADIWAFRNRNVIKGYLGRRNTVQPDVKHLSVQPGDKIILTSDGIHDNLTTKEMQILLTTAEGVNYAELLTATAYRRAKEAHDRAKMDDMTAVIIEV